MAIVGPLIFLVHLVYLCGVPYVDCTFEPIHILSIVQEIPACGTLREFRDTLKSGLKAPHVAKT